LANCTFRDIDGGVIQIDHDKAITLVLRLALPDAWSVGAIHLARPDKVLHTVDIVLHTDDKVEHTAAQ
jgi:hypothetical protein